MLLWNEFLNELNRYTPSSYCVLELDLGTGVAAGNSKVRVIFLGGFHSRGEIVNKWIYGSVWNKWDSHKHSEEKNMAGKGDRKWPSVRWGESGLL